jgi:chitinase
MTYDLFGTWDETDIYVGAYVYADTNMTQTIVDMDLLWRNNIDPSQVNLGLGFYGRSELQWHNSLTFDLLTDVKCLFLAYTLSDPSCTEAGCPFSSGGERFPGLQFDTLITYCSTGNPGACTQASGMLSYDEILQSLAASTNPSVTLDTVDQVEIAVWDTNQWVGYDTPETLQMKLAYANSVCLGG